MKKELGIISIGLMLLILGLSGCTTDNAGGNTVILMMHEKMFDFSTGQIVTEEGTTEDIDVLLINDDGEARLISRNFVDANDVGIKVSGDAEYSYYIDVPVGTVCKLKDNEGGIATFTVLEITGTSESPSVKISWSYQS